MMAHLRAVGGLLRGGWGIYSSHPRTDCTLQVRSAQVAMRNDANFISDPTHE